MGCGPCNNSLVNEVLDLELKLVLANIGTVGSAKVPNFKTPCSCWGIFFITIVVADVSIKLKVDYLVNSWP